MLAQRVSAGYAERRITSPGGATLILATLPPVAHPFWGEAIPNVAKIVPV